MLTVQALITATERTAALHDAVGWARHLHLAYAWASSAAGTAEHWRSLPLEKVKQAVIGLHFAQTEPHVLRSLHTRRVLRVCEDTTGVFHPKVLVATNGKAARIIVGSSNFTVGGFGKNTEVNVLLSGSSSDATVMKLLDFVDSQWKRAVNPDEARLAEYEALYDARPRPPPMGGTRSRSMSVAKQDDTQPAETDVVEFHDRDGSIVHDDFQDWRQAHPNGFYLTFKSKQRVNLHRTTCWHQGTYRFGEYDSSATKARKICAKTEEALRQWAKRQGVGLTRCPHCVEYDPRTLTRTV